MDFQNITIFVVSIVTTGLMGVVTYIGWLRRHSRGGNYFFWMALAATVWVFAYALEAISPGLSAKVFWAKMQYFGIASISTLWFLFAAVYSQKNQWLNRNIFALLWVVPVITFSLVMTNEFHNLIWTSIELNTTQSVVIFTRGLWSWVFTGYSYLGLLGGTLLIVLTAQRSWTMYRNQSGALVLGALLPWIGNAIYIAGLVPVPGLDITPFTFVLTGLVLTWGLYGFHLFDVMPVARDVLLENMNDGMLVLDQRNRVIDANAAAIRMLKRPAAPMIGEPVEKIMASLPLMANFITEKPDGEIELQLSSEPAEYINLRVSPLLDIRRQVIGRLVELRDITDRKMAEFELHENEARFRSVLENAATGIIVVNSHGDIEFANSVAVDIFGYAPNELMGKPVEMLLPETFRTHHVQLRGEYIRQPAVRKMGPEREVVGRRKDGEEVFLEIGLSYLETKKDLLVTAFILDITDRKLNEQALRESEARNRSLIASLAEAIVVQDTSGAIISFNTAAERILGLTTTLTLSRSRIDDLWKPIHGDGTPFLPELHPALATLRTGQRCSNVIMGIRRPNHKITWVSVNSEPLILPGETDLFGVVPSYFDITERKEIEEKLAQNERRYRMLADNAADVIWSLDLQGVVVYASPSVEWLLGISPEALIGQSIDKILAEPTGLPFLKELKEYALTLKPVQDENRLLVREVALKHADGSTVWAEVVNSGLFGELGRPLGILGVARDISVKREANQLREDMTHMMVHDLRNPLSSIATTLAALLHGTFGAMQDSQIEAIRLAQSSSTRMMQLINDILDINRLESKKIEMDQRAVHLEAMIDELLKSENSLAEHKKITLERKIPPALPMVLVDAGLIRRVMQNLVGNALKFTPEGGNVQVLARQGAQEDRPVIFVTVKDSGPGIPPEVMEHLFQKFVTGKHQDRGSGLGLTFCKLAIEAHGEQIWVENCPGEGAVLTFTLPVLPGSMSNMD